MEMNKIIRITLSREITVMYRERLSLAANLNPHLPVDRRVFGYPDPKPLVAGLLGGQKVQDNEHYNMRDAAVAILQMYRVPPDEIDLLLAEIFE